MIASEEQQIQELMDSAKILLKSIHGLLNSGRPLTPSEFEEIAAMNEALRLTRQLIIHKEGGEKGGKQANLLGTWIVSVIAQKTLPHFNEDSKI